ncbi:type II secretion system ATPase GspE [Neptunomonas phycophila]|uniref:type II secretion system ATPase GspE n=1 Tax=Neptunomonas phycophila TaxID=1572645 RepID=UPI0026E24B17|nr:type II secretion system ATPase GspE [Neptunomonas phycophila]MDO6784683.1 type II secretion system ATPase GspE [Neptunomonas phycophila]
MAVQPAFSYSFARKHIILALINDEGVANVSYSTDTSTEALLEVDRLYANQMQLKLVPVDELKDAISLAYQAADNSLENISDINEVIDLDALASSIPESEDLLDAQDDAPVIRLINALFAEALRQQASDIHLETFENSMSVRLRVDGVLQEVLKPNRALAPLLISRIKVMAKLDIAERRVPQDGRVSLKMAGKALDVRISTMPSIHGERVVMRLLDKQASRMDLTHLGMPSDTLASLTELLAQPNGIILVTGPTGSGKTTTLYASLSMINDRSRNILTVEDPVEYALEGIGQTPVNTKSGMTFAKGLRAILRQDPDVVMIGEIRDPETAQIAVQASLTGHLVLSTLHTNDSLGAITRLMDIGVEPYLIASAVKGVLAQRLVRTLCQHCRTQYRLTDEDARALGDSQISQRLVFENAGCDQCNHTGYAGRKGIYEMLVIDRPLSRLIHDCAGEHKMAEYANKTLVTMLDQGRDLVLAGVTSPAEVLRMVKESADHAIL